jgi:hypothetical protein
MFLVPCNKLYFLVRIMLFDKDKLAKEVFELELFKQLKEQFPNEDLESVVIETLEIALGNSELQSSDSFIETANSLASNA